MQPFATCLFTVTCKHIYSTGIMGVCVSVCLCTCAYKYAFTYVNSPGVCMGLSVCVCTIIYTHIHASQVTASYCIFVRVYLCLFMYVAASRAELSCLLTSMCACRAQAQSGQSVNQVMCRTAWAKLHAATVNQGGTPVSHRSSPVLLHAIGAAVQKQQQGGGGGGGGGILHALASQQV